MNVETINTLLYCSFPVVVIVTVVIYVIVNKNKDKPVDTTPPQFYGMRSPTLEEAAEIKAEVAPRNGKVVLVLSLVMLPLAVCAGGAAISMYGEEDLGVVIIMGSVAAGVLLMYIGFISLPLHRIISLLTKSYSVGECYFDDVKHLIRVNHRGIPCDVYHAVIKDAIGTTWEADLPKELRFVQVGARCLVVIYASEKKVNRSPTNGKSLYRRDIFVPRDELMRYK
jgi:hypothetical protein